MSRRLRDDADWTDVRFESANVGSGRKPQSLVLDGYHYATQGEWQLANLLKQQDVPFTPDVRFSFHGGESTGRERAFIPDFLFNGQAFVWTGRGKRKLIHGIEAKGKSRTGQFSPRALENVQMLQKQRGIVILLLSNSQIKQYFAKGHLPLRPLLPTER